MSKILLIGRFNETTKRIHGGLSSSFQIQLCSDNVAIAVSMLGMYGPSLVLINLEGLSEGHKELFQVLATQHQHLPVLAVGTEGQKEMFSEFFQEQQISYQDVAVENEALVAEIRRSMYTGMGEDTEEPGASERKYVLLVDDSPVILRGMKQMLEEKYRVGMVTSGEQALKALEKEKPDVIILDYEMPGCDGRETLQMIREQEETKEIPVVFLTGHGDAAHIRSVLDLRPAAYFLKPPKAEKILEILGQLL